MTPKPCKWCGSIWHSKNKCEKREISPFKPVYNSKGTKSRLDTENPSERPRLAYKSDNERSQLIGYADKFFSLYVRVRGGDGSKNTCFTCSVKLPYGDLQCGHFINRRYLNTRWNEMNCWPQCNECNVEKGGNLKLYEALLVVRFGQDAVDGLRELAQRNTKVTEEHIKDVIDKYKGVVF